MRLVNFIAFLLLTLTLSNASCVIASPSLTTSFGTASFGTHGMVLFGGRDGLFLSHLAMFHAPHDYQVVLEIELSDAVIQQKLRATLEATPRLWTINPEPFALTDFWTASRPLQTFKAELFEGHFERGGESRFKGVQINVRQVLFHQHLAPSSTAKLNANYQIVQRGSTVYLVKRLNMRPDFDHIVRLSGFSVLNPMGAPITLAISGVAQPSNAQLETALAKAKVRAKIGQTIYFDTADLK
jgi:hypothetical protein